MKNLTPVERPLLNTALFFIMIAVLINLVYVGGALIDKGFSEEFSLFIKNFYFDLNDLPRTLLILALVPLSITIGVFKKFSWGLALHIIGYLLGMLVANLLSNDPGGLVIFEYLFMLPFSLLIVSAGIAVGRLFFNTNSKLSKIFILIILLIVLVALMLNYTILY